MEIDIRDNGKEAPIKSIRFSDQDLILRSPLVSDQIWIKEDDVDEDEPNKAIVFMRDIDNLIKALEHAKKIWS